MFSVGADATFRRSGQCWKRRLGHLANRSTWISTEARRGRGIFRRQADHRHLGGQNLKPAGQVPPGLLLRDPALTDRVNSGKGSLFGRLCRNLPDIPRLAGRPLRSPGTRGWGEPEFVESSLIFPKSFSGFRALRTASPRRNFLKCFGCLERAQKCPPGAPRRVSFLKV